MGDKLRVRGEACIEINIETRVEILKGDGKDNENHLQNEGRTNVT